MSAGGETRNKRNSSINLGRYRQGSKAKIDYLGDSASGGVSFRN
jgi:hypothetical protein